MLGPANTSVAPPNQSVKMESPAPVQVMDLDLCGIIRLGSFFFFGPSAVHKIFVPAASRCPETESILGDPPPLTTAILVTRGLFKQESVV